MKTEWYEMKNENLYFISFTRLLRFTFPTVTVCVCGKHITNTGTNIFPYNTRSAGQVNIVWIRWLAGWLDNWSDDAIVLLQLEQQQDEP